jgi:hypothetical protein
VNAADVLGTMPAWVVQPDRPVVVSPTGREFKLASTREQAVHVIRTVSTALLECPDTDHAAMRAMPLVRFYGLVVKSIQDQAEDVVGAATAQLLDVMLWGLSWDDVAPEAGDA